jgi:hypothetical protein
MCFRKINELNKHFGLLNTIKVQFRQMREIFALGRCKRSPSGGRRAGSGAGAMQPAGQPSAQFERRIAHFVATRWKLPVPLNKVASSDAATPLQEDP